MEQYLKPTILLCEPDYDKAQEKEALLRARDYCVTCISTIDQIAFERNELIAYGFDQEPIDLRLTDYAIALFDGDLQGEQPPLVWAIIPWLIQMGIPCLAVGSTEGEELMLGEASFSITTSDFEFFVDQELPAIYASAIAIRGN